MTLPQREVQEKELAVIRDFESRILTLQDEETTKRVTLTTGQSESLARLSRSFRQFVRAVGGEELDRTSEQDANKAEDFEPWSASYGADWALERESELARLEKENDELKRMLALHIGVLRSGGEPPKPSTLSSGLPQAGKASGDAQRSTQQPHDVPYGQSPYGTFKAPT